MFLILKFSVFDRVWFFNLILDPNVIEIAWNWINIHYFYLMWPRKLYELIMYKYMFYLYCLSKQYNRSEKTLKLKFVLSKLASIAPLYQSINLTNCLIIPIL